jgi:hypothetical protein
MLTLGALLNQLSDRLQQIVQRFQNAGLVLEINGGAQPSLSSAYFIGWAQTLTEHSADISNGMVKLLPCVYATRSDNVTWQAVARCAQQGVLCSAAWIARCVHRGCVGLDTWDGATVNPAVQLPRWFGGMRTIAGLEAALTVIT